MFHSKGLKGLYKYSKEGFTFPIDEMQPLLEWKTQLSYIRLSDKIILPPLQDENAGAVTGRTLFQAEFKNKFPSGTFGNAPGDIS